MHLTEPCCQVAILSDVFNTLDDNADTTDHGWMLYITDILDLRGVLLLVLCSLFVSCRVKGWHRVISGAVEFINANR